jgi:hypothetical protein
MIVQIDTLLESFGYSEMDKKLYMEMIENRGAEYTLNSLLRDLPDGYSRGSLRLKDINRRLNQLGC